MNRKLIAIIFVLIFIIALFSGCVGEYKEVADWSRINKSRHTDNPPLVSKGADEYFYIDIPVEIEILAEPLNYGYNLVTNYCSYNYKIYANILNQPYKYRVFDDAPDGKVISEATFQSMSIGHDPQLVKGDVYGPAVMLDVEIVDGYDTSVYTIPNVDTKRPILDIINYDNGSSEFNKSMGWAVWKVYIDFEDSVGNNYGGFDIDISVPVWLPFPCSYKTEDNDPMTSKEYHNVRSATLRLFTPLQIIISNFITVQVVGYLHEGKAWLTLPTTFDANDILIWAIKNYFISLIQVGPVVNLIWMIFKWIDDTSNINDWGIKWYDISEISSRTYYYKRR